MAGIFTDFWKIIPPVQAKSRYVGSASDYNSYNNFSWNSKLLKGAGGRFQNYSQYKNMDSDVFVSRALDTIAGEMTTEDIKTNLPFRIAYQNEANQEIPANIIVTVRSALRHWCDLHDLGKKVYDIARNTIKYGDCFFNKTSDFQPWNFIEQTDVLGVALGDFNKKEFYQVKKSGTGGVMSVAADMELIPSPGMIHFTMSSGIGESGPFGDSILHAAIKAYRHLSLLEESVIIYRIVRAPERRVFSIDVGNMPPQRANAYMQSIKNEIKQKRIPSTSGGQEKVDSVYNPLSVSEDFFFMKTADGRGSTVDTLAGGESTGKIDDVSYFQNKFLQALRLPSTYMKGSDEAGAVIQDGKVGVAFIEEQLFVRYTQRLQRAINPVFDEQFKCYLKSAGINIDHNLFKIELNPPQNFDIYKQAEIDEKLMSNFNNIKDVSFIANRTKLSRYLGWTEDEIQMNEELLKQELSIPDGGISDRMSELRMIYDPAWIEARPKPKIDDSFENYVEASKKFSEEPEKEGTEEELAPDEAGEEEFPEDSETASSGEEVSADESEEETGKEDLPSIDDMKKTLEG